jgi:glutamate carboxypeptidase
MVRRTLQLDKPTGSEPAAARQMALLASLRGRTEEMTELLGRFVRCESPTDAKAAVDRFGRIVAAEWRRRGADVEVLRQRASGDHLRVNWPRRTAAGMPQQRPILVLGHLDTVYACGTLARMPFRVSRGRAYGPGTFDMKGGLVIALFAADARKSTLQPAAATRCFSLDLRRRDRQRDFAGDH